MMIRYKQRVTTLKESKQRVASDIVSEQLLAYKQRVIGIVPS